MGENGPRPLLRDVSRTQPDRGDEAIRLSGVPSMHTESSTWVVNAAPRNAILETQWSRTLLKSLLDAIRWSEPHAWEPDDDVTCC